MASLKHRFFPVLSFVVIGLGGLLLFRVHQGKVLFDSLTRSYQVRQAVRETETVLQEYNRLVTYFVLFHDKSQESRIYQVHESLIQRLDEWEKLVDQGWGLRTDLAAVKIDFQRLFLLRAQILRLVERGQIIEAIDKVRNDYLIASSQVEERIKLAAGHLDDDARRMMNESNALIDHSRTLFKAGAFLVVILLILFFARNHLGTMLQAFPRRS